ncbi:MAG: hypothetical protein IKT00_03935 [Prevotella sp.]|nr:hypothetical protein [Prevotella sp.]
MAHPWLTSRRQILDNNYRLPPEGTAEVDALFSKMEQLAMQCGDQATFEQQMATSPLSQEYNNLMAKYSKYYLVNGQTTDENLSDMKKQAAASAAKEAVKSGVERELHIAAVRAMPEPLRELKFGGLRVVPVIGPIIQWIGNIRWIYRLFGGGRKDDMSGQDPTQIQ